MASLTSSREDTPIQLSHLRAGTNPGAATQDAIETNSYRASENGFDHVFDVSVDNASGIIPFCSPSSLLAGQNIISIINFVAGLKVLFVIRVNLPSLSMIIWK